MVSNYTSVSVSMPRKWAKTLEDKADGRGLSRAALIRQLILESPNSPISEGETDGEEVEA